MRMRVRISGKADDDRDGRLYVVDVIDHNVNARARRFVACRDRGAGRIRVFDHLKGNG